MKVFIVSLAIIIMQLSSIIFASDLFRYNNARFRLKLLAEECAAGCAVQYDDDEYENGNIVFRNDAASYASDLISYKSTHDPVFMNGTLRLLSFEAKSDTDSPYVAVSLSYTADRDYFRLPIINEHTISHQSKYEFVVIEDDT